MRSAKEPVVKARVLFSPIFERDHILGARQALASNEVSKYQKVNFVEV